MEKKTKKWNYGQCFTIYMCIYRNKIWSTSLKCYPRQLTDSVVSLATQDKKQLMVFFFLVEDSVLLSSFFFLRVERAMESLPLFTDLSLVVQKTAFLPFCLPIRCTLSFLVCPLFFFSFSQSFLLFDEHLFCHRLSHSQAATKQLQ